jgi:hypothetical protein
MEENSGPVTTEVHFSFRATDTSCSENTTLQLRWFSFVLQQLCIILKKECSDIKVIATTLEGNELLKIVRLIFTHTAVG